MTTKIKNDDYDLINSKAIKKYCRKVKYQFNTEELAVLIFRNRSMDLDEKNAKYQDLIDNYPDMEVIERINCKHYDSVKTMIRNEINRNKEIYEDFIKQEKNCVYIWYEYNKLAKDFSSLYQIINNTKRNYKECYESVKKYIREYDDTISFTIVKKYFDKKERKIYAKYSVIEKKAKLIKIYDNEDDYLDINNIFVYMPTPFKKGDILISEQPSMRNCGDNEDIFVLDYLCIWRENIKEYLAKGNHDSSDMVGYGYYLYKNMAQIIYDNKWDYDSFEYYEGKLEDKKRILRLISSFLKGKIELELFIKAYNYFKSDYETQMPNCFIKEHLKLAGFSDFDISKINGEYKKIYNMSEENRMYYIKYFTNGLKGIKEENIKQIETDFDNNVFVLTIDNELYKNGKIIDKKIEKIYMLDGLHLYKITDDNIIRPITDEKEWDNMDKYLNNNNCSYKKIVTSIMNIVAK